MSKLSLRAAFTLGLQSTLAAQQVFTDRVTEIAAFDASLDALQRSLSAAELSPVIDAKRTAHQRSSVLRRGRNR